MAPVRSYYNWNQRKSDTNEAIEPYRKYFFICEGANTETWYFEKLVDYKKELGINPNIDIRFLEKTQQDKNISFPRRLIEFAEEQKLNSDISFDAEMDRMIIVFDADIFEEKVKDFDEVVAFGENNNILGISNPAFELFLRKNNSNAGLDIPSILLFSPNATTSSKSLTFSSKISASKTIIILSISASKDISELSFCSSANSISLLGKDIFLSC